VNYDRFIRGYILGYRRYVRAKTYRRLIELIEREYTDVLSYARRHTCPFCGRRFASKRGLMRHTYGGKCALSFNNLINEIVDRYREIRGSGGIGE